MYNLKNLKMKLSFLSVFLCFMLLSTPNFGQYLETFSTPNKGILAGPCGGTAASCASSDFVGVDWTINGNFVGFDSDDIMATNAGGVLFVGGDIDEELCFESPILDISGVGGTFTVAADIGWIHHDNAEYVDVDYSIDGGGWITIPNQFGANPGTSHTVDFPGSGNTGSGTVTLGGLSGSNTVSVRVCVDSNTASNGESHTIDNVSVPEAILLGLPVDLISFNAQERDGAVNLYWKTAFETQNEKFEIEHSTNNSSFRKVGEIQGNRSTLQLSNYTFYHQKPNRGENYYRLKQIDFNGNFEYSNIVSIKLESNRNIVGEIYPNPTASRMVNLSYDAMTAEHLSIAVFSISGKLETIFPISILKGENNLQLDLSTLSNGIYLLNFSNAINSNWRKLILH